MNDFSCLDHNHHSYLSLILCFATIPDSKLLCRHLSQALISTSLILFTLFVVKSFVLQVE